MSRHRLEQLVRVHLIFLASSATLLLGLPLLSGTGALPAAAAGVGDASPQSLTQEVDAHIARAQEILDRLLAVQGKRTAANTLSLSNDISIEIGAAASKAGLLENVHPDPDVRAAAEIASQTVSRWVTDLTLNRDMFEALKAVDVSGEDALTRRYLERQLRDYRRAGVDKDEDTRNRIRALREELVEIGQEFDRNIREGTRSIQLDSVDELDGLPEDYITAHPPDESGKITITTDYPDYLPFITYAKSAEARRRLYIEFNNRAYPANEDVLNRLIAKRHELANLLGYDSWAAYITDDKMVGTAKGAAEFVKKLDKATRERAKRDYDMLLARKRKDFPKAKVVQDYEKSYYGELVKAEEFDFDSQELRAYYDYPAVKQGILDITARLFSVRYEPLPDAEVWHPSVEAFELYEGDDLLGRFYLDMHPREGKYKHAAQFDIQSGLKGRQIPVAALICNFPGGSGDGPALMEHDDVETFLHEFGHLLHTLFGGRQDWIDFSGVATEWDFVEAPSQMLEEWALDAPTLQTFARHHETGEPIPGELIDKLKASRDFGNGTYVRQQTFYTAISLNIYNRDPGKVNLAKLVPELQAKYSSFPYVEGAHMYSSFGHLEGYSAMYYTYMWSLVIAKDLFSQFDRGDMLNPETATRYRRLVLERGGSKDAADLVEDFLGRPYNFEAFRAWLNRAS